MKTLKKLGLAVMLLGLMFILMTGLGTTASAIQLLGDVDNDGYTTALDARLILRMAAKLENITNLYPADINCDDRITASDARKALRISGMLDVGSAYAPVRTIANNAGEEISLSLQVAKRHVVGIDVVVCIKANNATGTEAFNLFIEYDNNYLEFVSIEEYNSDNYDDISMLVCDNINDSTLSISGLAMESINKSDPEIAVVTFKLKKEGNTTISCQAGTWAPAPAPKKVSVNICTHNGGTATCKTQAKCTLCGQSYGSLGSHNYASATCTAPKTCNVCKVTSGKALGHKYTNACDTSCNTCGATRKITHSYKNVLTKATLSKSGKIENKCSVCGKVSKTTTIWYPKDIALSATKFSYNGKTKTPVVAIVDSQGNALINGTDYTIKYSAGRTNVGKYGVTITFKGNYSGTVTKYFLILPGKTTKITTTTTATTLKAQWNKVTGATGYKVEVINSSGKVVKTVHTRNNYYTFSGLTTALYYKVKVTAYKTIKDVNNYSLVNATTSTYTAPSTPTLTLSSTAKGKATIKWSNVNRETGYQVYYSTSKNGTYSKVATYSANYISGSKSKLTSGKTYYFKVRAYKKVGNTVYYSGWSTVKSVKIK